MVLNLGSEVSSGFTHKKSITLARLQVYHALSVAIGVKSRDKRFTFGTVNLVPILTQGQNAHLPHCRSESVYIVEC